MGGPPVFLLPVKSVALIAYQSGCRRQRWHWTGADRELCERIVALAMDSLACALSVGTHIAILVLLIAKPYSDDQVFSVRRHGAAIS